MVDLSVELFLFRRVRLNPTDLFSIESLQLLDHRQLLTISFAPCFYDTLNQDLLLQV
jgi:hypothetical protein